MADAVHREIVLPVPRERAWELLTDPRELAEWLADDIELEPAAGAPVRAAWDDGVERTGTDDAVVDRAGMRFTWSDGEDLSEVTWTLQDAPGGTRVVVEERLLVPAGAWGPTLAAGPQMAALSRAAVLVLA